MKRNNFLETDGLFWESETHEWFNDTISTQYAQKKSITSGDGEQNDALDIVCFIIRNKETGEYDRVIFDRQTEEVIYDTKSLEELCFQIDKMKTAKRFK